MTTVTTTRVTPVDRALRRWLRWIRLYADLTKAKLSLLVLTTTVGGYMVTSPSSIHWVRLLWAILGTFAAAACANALNQWLELKQDAGMLRTEDRPLPRGHISSAHSLVVGVVVGTAGVAALGAFVNALTAALALLTILLYVFVYTPLKQRTPAAVLPGAVVGAIPPMIGCAAASGRLEPLAWVLGAVLFVWQGPHFLSLAWLHRDDYRRVGFRVLPQADVEGVVAGRAALVCSAKLLPVTLLVFVTGAAGWVYAIGALVLGLWLLAFAWRFARQRTAREARRLFLAGIIYLLLLMGLMVIDSSGARTASTRAGDIPANEAAASPLSKAPAPGPLSGSQSGAYESVHGRLSLRTSTTNMTRGKSRSGEVDADS